MGLFDKILGVGDSQAVTLDKREAFTSVLLVAVASDGHISSEESEAFIAVSNRMQLFRDQPPSQFNSMINKLVGILTKQGPAFLLQKAHEALPCELRETAFAVATDLIFADGVLEVEEKNLLEELQESLGIEEEMAIRVIEVLSIKNRG